MNQLLATIGSTQPHLCILLLDETLLNVTDIAMGLHLLRVPLDSVEGKCLVITIGMLLVCHHIVTTKTTKSDYIFCLDITLDSLSDTIVKFLFCFFILQWKTTELPFQHTPHSMPSPATLQ